MWSSAREPVVLRSHYPGVLFSPSLCYVVFCYVTTVLSHLAILCDCNTAVLCDRVLLCVISLLTE